MQPKMIGFMQYRRTFAIASIVVVLLSLFGLFRFGLNFSIDFTGGTLVELSYKQQDPDLNRIRDLIESKGFQGASVQYFGGAKDILIRLPTQQEFDNASLGDEITQILAAEGEKPLVERVEFVGPRVGKKLARSGIEAMLVAILGILIYVSFRFQIRLASGAIIAILHDVIITIGLFAWTGFDFDLATLAAILALVGYSLNDTIVIFDRIRDNFRTLRHVKSVEVVNISVNQTMQRSIVTSVLTLLVVFCLLVWGGETIFGFAVALFFGVIVGTYSSIFIASTWALALSLKRDDFIVTEDKKETT